MCNSCGLEKIKEETDLIPLAWFDLSVAPTITYGTVYRNIPLRQTSALRFIGDYCSLDCLKKALTQAAEEIMESVENEISEINSSKSFQNVNNIGDGS
jgi:hypothetical protein